MKLYTYRNQIAFFPIKQAVATITLEISVKKKKKKKKLYELLAAYNKLFFLY